LSSSLNLSEVLDQILASVGQVVPHAAADIMFLEDGIARIERSTGYIKHGLVETEEEITKVRLRTDEIANLRWIIEHKQPLAIADTQTYEQWVSVNQSHRIRSCLSAPILIDKEVIGFINVNSLVPEFFTNQEDKLQTFANQAAVAIRNARLYQQAQKLAALEERQRLARDLHDAVSQTLFSASVIAESLPRLWEREPGKVRSKLLQLSRLNRGALAEMRTLLLELRPAALLNTSLGELVTQLAEAIKGRREIAISLDVQDQQPLPPDVHIALYRIVQEALNNIMKHAQASEIEIYVRSQPQQVEIHIQDNGRGFDVPARAPGLGLGTMHERAETIRALLEIKSQVGEGTKVFITWSAG
jgi:two-component system nitrate/nitrite sensor histidine kinase NarX